MYKVMLVEDEASVREGIAQKLDWFAHGFVLAASCEDGREALEFLKEQSVDVIITDIHMPNMDGLELTGWVVEHCPDTIVIILTGFSDFEYAKRAIHLHVHEYLLKPVTARQLRNLLDKLCRLLDDKAAKQAVLAGRASATDKLLWEPFCLRYFTGSFPPDSFRKTAAEFDLELQSGSYQVVLVTKVFAGDLDQISDAAITAAPGDLPLRTMFPEWKILPPINTGDGDLILICNNTSGMQIAAEIMQLSDFGKYFSCSIGKSVANPDMLLESYASALQAAEVLYTLPPGSQVPFDRYPLTFDSLQSQSSIRKQIISSLKLRDRQQVDENLQVFFSHMKTLYIRREEVIRQFQRLALQMAEYAEEEELPACPPGDTLDYILGSRHIDEGKTALSTYAGKLMEAAAHKKDSTRIQILAATEYMEANFHRPALSLHDVTNHLSMSTSHFSTLFKNQIGVTFIEYLTRLRMEKARNLLITTDLKSYEIAEKVGYDDPGYFGSLFKKHTGQGPSEYRKHFE